MHPMHPEERESEREERGKINLSGVRSFFYPASLIGSTIMHIYSLTI